MIETAMPSEHKRRGPAPLLGNIVWFTVGGETTYEDDVRLTKPMRVKYAEVEDVFEQLGLDVDLLPPPPRPIDAFRKATATVAAKYPLSEGSTITVTLETKEVSRSADEVVRHVMRTVKSEGKLSPAQRVAELRFLRGSRRDSDEFRFSIRPNVPANERARLRQLISMAVDEYTVFVENLTANSIRWVLRAHLDQLAAVAVRPSGGVYFVSNEYDTTVLALQKFMNHLGDGCYLHRLPLLDEPEQRAMVNSAMESSVETDIRELMRDIRTYTGRKSYDNRISPAKYAEFNGRLQATLQTAKDYGHRLGLPHDRAMEALHQAEVALSDLSARIDERMR